MSSDGGVGRAADDTTSFVPRPPDQEPGQPAVPVQAPEPPGEPGAGRLIAGRYRLLGKLGHALKPAELRACARVDKRLPRAVLMGHE